MTYVIGKDAWEVGFSVLGCREETRAVVLEQRKLLQKLLDSVGADVTLWAVAPHIREVHNHDATVGLLDYGKFFAVNTEPCLWAVYGVVRGEHPPRKFYVPEGVRLPEYSEGAST